MALTVTKATEADIDRLTDIQFSALGHDPYHQALYIGDPASQAVRKDASGRTVEEWRSDSSLRFMKCTDIDGAIVGFAKWEFFEVERPESEWKKRPVVDWCEGRRKEIAENCLFTNSRLREKTWGGRPYLLLGLLCVHKDHQRKGVGKVLLQWGLEYSAKVSLPVYLEASPAGYGLYLQYGFRQIDVATIKAEDWDGDHDFDMPALVRDAPKK